VTLTVHVIPRASGVPARYAPGPADLAKAGSGDTIVLSGATAEDAAAWAPALWFALARGAAVETR
jgi:ABC-type Zn uptake system ZnuABC Zn-binding protein ZnuA